MKRYTVVCPGAQRFEEGARKKMGPNDKRLHYGHGWETEVFPRVCPECGDEAQPRGAYEVTKLEWDHSNG